jgi:hypothetical protein
MHVAAKHSGAHQRDFNDSFCHVIPFDIDFFANSSDEFATIQLSAFAGCEQIAVRL